MGHHFSDGHVHDALVELFGIMHGRPGPVDLALQYIGATRPPPVSIDEIVATLGTCHPSSETFTAVRHGLARFDNLRCEGPLSQTLPNTASRRNALYDAMQASTHLRKVFDARYPWEPTGPSSAVQREETSTWFERKFLKRPSPVFSNFARNLLRGGFDPVEMARVEEGCSRVVRLMGRPSDPNRKSTRGLACAEVQSGKTVYQLGVCAMAIDVGYRLIVILAGMTDFIRIQTQLRLERDLIGGSRSNGRIVWRIGDDFIEGRLLTDPDHEYKSAGKNIDLFAIPKGVEGRLDEQGNLDRMPVKILVIKKNKAPLQALVGDLVGTALRNGVDLHQVPTVIIDDEADQASPTTGKGDERTTINRLIVDLCERTHAQYLGVTATPAALLLQRRSDMAGLFPRDYVVRWRPGRGYMGFQSFFNIVDGTINADHVRLVTASNEDGMIREATDSYVLAGAMRLFRRDHGVRDSRHHTMLFHREVSIRSHAVAAAYMQSLWKTNGYRGGAGTARLVTLLEEFRAISNRLHPELPFPADYAELAPYVERALRMIDDPVTGPTVVVNSETGSELEFEGESEVWKIVVGGAKLSRGFTIEGLTVSFYGRRTMASDTNAQNARWHGYRLGRVDLVRLYVRTDAASSAKTKKGAPTGTVDLSHSLRASMYQEQSLFEQLDAYDHDADVEGRITPEDLPPLIEEIGLPPTSRAKLRHATVTVGHRDQRGAENKFIDVGSKDRNWNLLERLARSATDWDDVQAGPGRTYRCARVSVEAVREFVRDYQFARSTRNFTAEKAFLAGADVEAVDGYVLCFPMVQSDKDNFDPVFLNGWKVKQCVRTLKEGYPSSIAAGEDQQLVERLAGWSDSSRVTPSAEILNYVGDRRVGFVIVYPSRAGEREPLRVGFRLVRPFLERDRSGIPKATRIFRSAGHEDVPGRMLRPSSTAAGATNA